MHSTVPDTVAPVLMLTSCHMHSTKLSQIGSFSNLYMCSQVKITQ
jgi:hypothetical protein